MPSLRHWFIKAVEIAAPEVQALAGRLGVTAGALRHWRLGNRAVSSEMARKMAKLLRRQARDALRVAAELEREAVSSDRREAAEAEKEAATA